MTPYLHRTIAERLAAVELAITNALADPDLLAPLAEWSYNEDKLNAGQAIHDAALALHIDADREHGEAVSATAALHAAREAANKVYMKHVKVARVALDDPGHLRDLGLKGRREDALLAWLDQARNFYRSALAKPEVLAELTVFGMDETKLQDGSDAIDAVYAARNVREDEAGEAQTATEHRDAALAVMDRWMGKFIRVARVAFEDDPQQLERLGIQA